MQEIKNFCEKLGSTSPTPGGGAASGICLSLAAACVEKAIRFSEVNNSEKIINEIKNIRESGLELSKLDEEAFLGWQEAKKLPKSNEEEKKMREEKINSFISKCIKVPLEICKNAINLSEIIKIFIPNCNKWLISDASIGAFFSDSAFQAGILNININLPFLKDKNLLMEIENFKTNQLPYFCKLSKETIEECKKILK